LSIHIQRRASIHSYRYTNLDINSSFYLSSLKLNKPIQVSHKNLSASYNLILCLSQTYYYKKNIQQGLKVNISSPAHKSVR